METTPGLPEAGVNNTPGLPLFPEANPYCLGNTLRYIGNPVESALSREQFERQVLVGKVSGPSEAKLINDFLHIGDKTNAIYREMLHYLINNYDLNFQDGEDVMKETQSKVWQKVYEFDLSKRARPWLYTIATNCCIDYLRRQKRHKNIVSLDRLLINKDKDENGESCQAGILRASPQKTAEDYEQEEIVRKSLDDLPQKSRQVIELVYFQGLKYSEAAKVLGIPLGTVKSRLAKSIKRLRENPLVERLGEVA